MVSYFVIYSQNKHKWFTKNEVIKPQTLSAHTIFNNYPKSTESTILL